MSSKYRPATDSTDAVTSRKEALLAEAVQHGDPGLRAAAQQRLATIRSDQGDFRSAWHWFAEATRSQPGAPTLAALELTLLAREQRMDEARERASHWLQRLAHLRQPELEPLFEYLEGVADGDDPLGRDRAQVITAVELALLLADAPAPVLRYTLRPHGDSSGPLRPVRKLEASLRRWHEAFPRISYVFMEEDEEDAIWAAADAWLPLLESDPILFDSFDVLHGLALAAQQLPDLELLNALAQRGEGLLRQALAAGGAPELGLDWSHHENRPAIRLIEDSIHEALDDGADAELAARLEWLVFELDRYDHNGMRFELQDLWLEQGRFEDVLRLAAAYPDDMPAMAYGRALALFASGRGEEAEAALCEAVRRGPKLIEWLLPEQRAEPPLDPRWTTVGGDDEAWEFRCRQRDLWQQHGALEWAAAVARRHAAATGSAPKPGGATP